MHGSGGSKLGVVSIRLRLTLGEHTAQRDRLSKNGGRRDTNSCCDYGKLVTWNRSSGNQTVHLFFKDGGFTSIKMG